MTLASLLEAVGMTAREALAWSVAAGVIVVALLVRRMSAWRRSWRARRRGRHAVAGEHAAETLLKRSGFRVIDRQARLLWEVEIDGTPTEIELRADLIAERSGRTFVAEVKTGAEAPSLTTAATRRQLLEYLVAYETDGVLLVDVDRGDVREITFPL